MFELTKGVSAIVGDLIKELIVIPKTRDEATKLLVPSGVATSL